jgi:hypothetical protein
VDMRKRAEHSALLAVRCRLGAVRSPRPLIAVAVAHPLRPPKSMLFSGLVGVIPH